MIKQFLRDSAIYTIPTIVSGLLNVLLLPIYTRLVSKEDFGALDLILMLSSIVQMLFSLEIGSGMARHYTESDDLREKRLYFSNATLFVLLLTMVFYIITFSFSSKLNMLVIGNESYEDTFKLALIWLGMQSFYVIMLNQLRWSFRSVAYSIVVVLYSTISISLSIVLVYYYNMGLNGILYGMLFSNSLCLFIAFGLVYKELILKIDIVKLKAMLKYSIPLVPSSISVFVSLYIDRIMINNYLDLSEVGVYSIGLRIAGLISIITIGFQNSLTPLIYKNYKDESAKTNLELIFRYFVIMALSLYLLMGLFSRELILLFSNSDYFSAYRTIIYLVPSFLFSQMYIFCPGLGIAKRTTYIMYINIFGGLLNIGLNVLLIPSMGIEGAGLATLIGYMLIFSIHMYYSQKFYFVNHKLILMTGFFLLTLVLIGLNNNFTFSYYYLANICILIIYFYMMYIFKLFYKEELIELYVKVKERIVG